MKAQFMRGQQLLCTLIGIHLLLGIFIIATFQNYIAPAIIDLLYAATARISVIAPLDNIDTASLQAVQAMIERSTYEQAVLAQQGRGLAFHIFWCILLYLGFNWVRILLGLSWLFSSISVIPLGILVAVFQFYHPLLLLLLITSLMYGIGGALLLFSPGVNTYMRMMRRYGSKSSTSHTR